MMKYLLEILIRYYVNKCSKDIKKLTDREELDAYLLRSQGAAMDVLKSNITIQTLRHFSSTNEKERWMAKGAALWLQIIKDRHQYAVKLQSIKEEKKKLELWQKFKINN